MKKYRIISGYQIDKVQDFALTPFLFPLFVKREYMIVFGFGISWGFYSVFISVGINVPKQIKSFSKLRKKNDNFKDGIITGYSLRKHNKCICGNDKFYMDNDLHDVRCSKCTKLYNL